MTTKNGSAADAENVDPTVDEIRAEADERREDVLQAAIGAAWALLMATERPGTG